MSTEQPKRVLLFGSSANPLRGLTGHLGAIQYCRANFDEIWLLPVYRHMYTTKRNLAPFHHRVRICELLINSLPEDGSPVKVKETEKELYKILLRDVGAEEGDDVQIKMGTHEIVMYLQAKHPGYDFSLLLGADTYKDLLAGKWNDGEELRQMVNLLVMERKGVESAAPEVEQDTISKNVSLITISGLDDGSSTKTRAMTDVDELRQDVGSPVAEYIVQNELYGFAKQ